MWLVFSCFPVKIMDLPQIRSISSQLWMLSFTICTSVTSKQSLKVLDTIQTRSQRSVPTSRL